MGILKYLSKHLATEIIPPLFTPQQLEYMSEIYIYCNYSASEADA